jgi:plastocyanin
MIRLALLAILVIGACGLCACADPVRPPATTDVQITRTGTTDAFTPASITVREGDTVRWTNADATAHQILSADGGVLFGSGSIGPAEQYAFTFQSAGTVEYSCTLHPGTTGTIIVESR